MQVLNLKKMSILIDRRIWNKNCEIILSSYVYILLLHKQFYRTVYYDHYYTIYTNIISSISSISTDIFTRKLNNMIHFSPPSAWRSTLRLATPAGFNPFLFRPLLGTRLVCNPLEPFRFRGEMESISPLPADWFVHPFRYCNPCNILQPFCRRVSLVVNLLCGLL